MERKLYVSLMLAAGLSLSSPAFAISAGAGGGPSGIGVGSQGTGPRLGVEVSAALYPAGVQPPAAARTIRGTIGNTEYTMVLSPHPLETQDSVPTGQNEDQSLQSSDREFYRTLAPKMVRIVTAPEQREQFDAFARAQRPIEVSGWVSGTASPLLTIFRIDSGGVDEPARPASAQTDQSPASSSSNIVRN